jgi:hypothetical protein
MRECRLVEEKKSRRNAVRVPERVENLVQVHCMCRKCHLRSQRTVWPVTRPRNAPPIRKRVKTLWFAETLGSFTKSNYPDAIKPYSLTVSAFCC